MLTGSNAIQPGCGMVEYEPELPFGADYIPAAVDDTCKEKPWDSW